MAIRKPKPKAIVGCEYCIYRNGDFFNDAEDKEIIRCYCKARHTHVNAEMMTKGCDFYGKNPEYRTKKDRPSGI